MPTYTSTHGSEKFNSTVYDWQDLGGTLGNYNWSAKTTLDAKRWTFTGLDIIPIGAEIKSVSLNISGSPNKRLHINNKDAGGAASSTIRDALNAGERNLSIYLTWSGSTTKRTDTHVKPSTGEVLSTTMPASSLTIEYEGGDGYLTRIRYGIGGEWVPCEAYYGEGGQWKGVEVSYGEGGQWHRIERTQKNENA